MLVAALLRLAWRMQRVAEQHEAGEWQLRIRGRHLCRDAPAHRLAADEERALRARQLRANRVDDRAITRLERRRAIRNLPPLLGVEKIEGDDVDAQRRQRVCEVDHERAALPGAGAMPEDEGSSYPGV